ncbi:hypothetical protein CDAR_603981 [Caerostris darwini]|uniref:Uncharacterized protein n=1 Tax=Caerostris darwini TaxID=1538125 RepID=A0AAV4RW26_9ARAC|nr:hypothetical protein CDAR_603981 [Caerostris darwini]
MYTFWEIVGYGVGAGFGAVVFPYLCLCCLGFTCMGVRGGSCAACCQSGIGEVEAGSCFACCQSAGAGGLACCCHVILFLVGFVTAVTLLAIYNPQDPAPHTGNSTTLSDFVNMTTPLSRLT